MTHFISPSHAADAIILKFKSRGGFESAEIKSYQESPRIYQALISKMKDLDVETKTFGIGSFAELGSPIEPSAEDNAFMRPPYISDLTLIQALVGFLGDKNPDVRNAASRELLKNVPDLYLRNFSKELIEIIAADPGITDAAELLATTGSERARNMIRTNPLIREQSETSTRKSLAKLGDSVIEKEIIHAYKMEKDPEDKAKLALTLGFIASPKSILVLAQDLRNPLTYPWNQQAHRSFRVDVIQGLHIAYPMEKLFWKPAFSPTEDSYYGAIEKWATDNLGVTWSNSRPPFLYETSVPTPLRRR